MNTQPNVFNLVTDVIDASPGQGIWSRTFHKGKGMNAVVMHLEAGEELTEHTSKHEAVIHALRGKAVITLGDEEVIAESGTWIHMPAKTPHSVSASDDFLMLLYLLK